MTSKEIRELSPAEISTKLRETREQLTQLRLLGCQMAQGFHLARPMPVDECAEWLCSHVATTITG